MISWYVASPMSGQCEVLVNASQPAGTGLWFGVSADFWAVNVPTMADSRAINELSLWSELGRARSSTPLP